MVDHRLTVALNLNHRGGLIGRNQWQPGQSQGEFILRELHLLAVLDKPCRERLRLQSGEGHDHLRLVEIQPLSRRSVPRPEGHMHIKRVPAPREIQVRGRLGLHALAVINRLAVGIEPLAYRLQNLQRLPSLTDNTHQENYNQI